MTRLTASTVLVMGLSAVMSSQAATIINQGNERGVGNVRWHKIERVDVNQIINKPRVNNAASLIFLRQADADGLQSSANIAINDRFQVSLQPGNYSQIYACSGVNQISGEITGHKNNNLLKNAMSFKFEPSTTYFFDVDVDNQGNTYIRHLTQDKATALLNTMNYQTHQITRVVPDCPPVPEPTVAPVTVVKATPNYEDIQLKVLFDNDKATVKTQYYPEIKRVADFMTQHPEVTATIEGHTDSKANDNYNLKLSQRRVDAVKQVLINTYHINGNRLNSIGYGESKPIADNTTTEGRQQNRRVVAVFQAN